MADASRVLINETHFSTMTDAQPRDLLGPAALLLMRLQEDHPPWRPLWHRATPHVLAAWAGRLYSPARASHGLPLKVLIMLMLMLSFESLRCPCKSPTPMRIQLLAHHVLIALHLRFVLRQHSVQTRPCPTSQRRPARVPLDLARHCPGYH